MSLLAQPGVTSRDIVTIQPVVYAQDSRGEDWGQTWTEKGRPIRAISRKLTSSELFDTGKTNETVAYNLYVEIPRSWREGDALPVLEKDRVWHPGGSRLDSSGDPDYTTSMLVRSVIAYPGEGICQIDVQRTY